MMTTQEEGHILEEIRALRKEMHDTAVKSSDDRAEIMASLAKNETDHKYIAEALLQINNAIFGNGTAGLKVMAQELDDRIEDLEKYEEARAADSKELKKQWRLLLFGILGTVSTIIVTWVWNMIIHAP